MRLSHQIIDIEQAIRMFISPGARVTNDRMATSLQRVIDIHLTDEGGLLAF
jgi:hypothetical protein